MQISVRVDDRDLQRKIRTLTESQLGRSMSKAINRTAFEVIEEEKNEARRVFGKASRRGQQLLYGKGSFVFDPATPAKLNATVHPNPNVKRRLEILEEHERGGIIVATAGVKRLAADGRLAIPINEAAASRRGTGRVSDRYSLQSLFDEGGRGFIAGNVILERIGQSRAARNAAGRLFGSRTEAAFHGFGKTRTRVLYVLANQADLPDTFRWYEVAERSAAKWFPIKAREEFEKITRGSLAAA
jgi:hypothetical protein